MAWNETRRGFDYSAYLKAKGGKVGASKGGRPKKGGQNGHVSVQAIAKDLGVPRKTAERQIKAADDYEFLRYAVCCNGGGAVSTCSS